MPVYDDDVAHRVRSAMSAANARAAAADLAAESGSASGAQQDGGGENAGDKFRTPGFPPRMTLEEKLKSLDEVPLFMRDLPPDEAGQAAKGKGKEDANAAIEALQALAFDGTPDGERERGTSIGDQRKSVPALLTLALIVLEKRSPRTSSRKATITSRASASEKRRTFTRKRSMPSRQTASSSRAAC